MVQAFERQRPEMRAEQGALVMWAVLGVESLHYLDDLVSEHTQFSPIPKHSPEVKDISHIRWAAGTSISSIDLCAAALGREYCGQVGEKKTKKFLKSSKKTLELRAKPPISARNWVDDVFFDDRYQKVIEARNCLTH